MGPQIYMETEMKLIYQNFDGLEIAFQCAIPLAILATLEQGKKEARDSRSASFSEIGPNHFPVMVHETGAKGGYTYQFSTGPDGEIWLIGDREARDQWNVRVRVRSLCLALYGYEKTKEKILDILLNHLLAKGPDENDKIPKERISRVDYCLDFHFMEEFQPSYLNFVCAGRAKKGFIGELPMQLESSGQSIEYIRVGKIPNRQIVIYNKTREISAKKKSYWWQLWGLNKSEFIGEIWRVEIRAGKKELNKWNLRSFNDFEKMIGDVISLTLNEFKYTNPNLNDKNMTRWPMSKLWVKSIKATEKDLIKYISNAERNSVLKELRDNIILNYKKLISGIYVGLTAATGKDLAQIPEVLDLVCDELFQEMSENPRKFIQKYNKKNEQFKFLDNFKLPN